MISKNLFLVVAIIMMFAPAVSEAAITGSYDNNGTGPTTYDASSGGGAGQNSTAGSIPEGLVTCGGLDCDACDLVNMVNRIVNFLITLLTIGATIMFVIAGFRLVTAGGDTSALKTAKSMFQNILIGFIIVLSAWLLVDTVLKTLTGDNKGLELWTKIDCGGIKNTGTSGTNGANVQINSNQNNTINAQQNGIKVQGGTLTD